MITQRNHTEEALDRLISIYKGARNFTKFIQSFQFVNDDIETYYIAILNSLNIDTASAEELDVLGKIIGMPRSKVGQFASPVFAYDNDPFNPFLNPNAGIEAGYATGFYIDNANAGEKIFIPIPDETYRRLLKAKIILNFFDGTVDAVALAMTTICEGNPSVVYQEKDNTPLRATFIIQKALNPLERIIFKGSYSRVRPDPNIPNIVTIFGSFVYPKTLGVWYDVQDLVALEFTYSKDGSTYGPVKGSNPEGVKFIRGSGYSDGRSGDHGVYWSGKS